MTIDPRLQVLYILGVGVWAFITQSAPVQAVLLGGQVLLWLVCRLPLLDLFRSVRRLGFFLVFLVASYAFFGPEEAAQWHRFDLFGLGLRIDARGLSQGLLRAAGIVAVILAAQIVQRAGSARTLVRGLEGLGAPSFLAYGLDLVLTTLGPDGGRRRGGRRGRRSERRRQEDDGGGDARRFEIRALLRGDVGQLSVLVHQRVQEAETRVGAYGLEPSKARDLALFVGLSVLALTLKMLRFMPGLPVAPGHKGVVLIPLYLLAARFSTSRWGGTQFGLVMGTTSFLFGMGKFGPFDIIRHVTPGIVVDLLLPVVHRLSPRGPKAWAYGVLGILAALARLSTQVLVALLVQAPAAFYALLLPAFVSAIFFGALSGYVSFHLIVAFERSRGAAASSAIAADDSDPAAASTRVPERPRTKEP